MFEFPDRPSLPTAFITPDTLPATDPLEVTAGQMFGRGSMPAATATTLQLPQERQLTDNAVVKGSVILLFIAFCLLIALFGAQIRALFSLFAGQKQSYKVLTQQGRLYHIFTDSVLWISLPVLLLLGVRIVDQLSLVNASEVGLLEAAIACVATAGTLAAIACYQWAMLKAAGRIALCDGFTDLLMRLRVLIFSLWMVLLTPLTLLWTIQPGGGNVITPSAIAALTAIIVLLLVVRSRRLFAGHGVSFLYWILYLCAVEIFPISLAVLLVMKN